MIGAGGIGAFPIAGLIARGVQVPEILDLVETAAQQLIQPWPWLELYTIFTPSSGTLRYVDFQDPDARGALGNQVPFDGNQFDARKIERSAIRSATDGVTTFTVELEDPDGSLVQVLRDEDGLAGSKVRIDLIPYNLLDQPALATTESYRIRQAAASTFPAKVLLECGLPSLTDIDIPILLFSRTRCINDYHRRHTQGVNQLCRAPSDDFFLATFQVLGSDENDAAATTWPAAETKRKYGWSTLNADIADTWKTSFIQLADLFPADLWTVFESSFPAAQIWKNAARSGMYMFKYLTGDFAVETNLDFRASVKAERNSGFIVQDPVSPGDWIFWGNAENSSAVEVLRRRVTTSDTSVDTDDTDLTDGAAFFRLERNGDDFEMFVKPDFDQPWVSKQTTTKVMGSRLRIGLVAHSDSGAAQDLLSSYFRFFRFTAGGPAACNRSLEDCQAEGRDNEHQFNGFPGIPNRGTNQ
jgi:hypothetical protein